MGRIRVWLVVVVAVATLILWPHADPALSGGDATVFDSSSDAFSLPLPGLTIEQRSAFFVGNSFFNDNWVTAPASTEGRDGLGPTFNAQSCSSCHFQDGRAQPPTDGEPELGLLIRLSLPGTDLHGGPVADPAYGDQLEDRAIQGVEPEGSVTITTEDYQVFGGGPVLALPRYQLDQLAFGPLDPGVMVSPRIAPQLPGMGLLEAVAEETIVAGADPDDANDDGVSGRANEVWNPATSSLELGRFGWKANVATLEQQTVAAFNGDIGITSSVLGTENCPAPQIACAAAINGGAPELDDAKLERVVFYLRTLAVPARRNLANPAAAEGEALFERIGCVACHTPTFRTGPAEVDSLADQLIHPYTDLLLHDMGDGLADGRPDFAASGSEWRTPPLWGIGLVEVVNRHTRFLHDGRARSLEEAILWHGGEAEAARADFMALPRDQMDAVVAFLESL